MYLLVFLCKRKFSTERKESVASFPVRIRLEIFFSLPFSNPMLRDSDTFALLGAFLILIRYWFLKGELYEEIFCVKRILATKYEMRYR